MKALLTIALLIFFIHADAQNYSRRPLLIVQNPISNETFSLRIGDNMKVQLDSNSLPDNVQILTILNDSTVTLSKLGVVPFNRIYSIRFTPRKANRIVKQILAAGSAAIFVYGYIYVASSGRNNSQTELFYLLVTTLISPVVIAGIEVSGAIVQLLTNEKIFIANKNLNLSVLRK